MSIKFTPARRFLDPGERIGYEAMELLSGGRVADSQGVGASAIVEPETVGLNELKLDEAIAAVELIDTNTFSGTFAATNSTAVAPETGVLLTEFTKAPAGVSSTDVIVRCDQRDDNLYFTAYIEQMPDGTGFPVRNVRFLAKNFGVASHSVGIGQLIRYSIFAGQKAVQPRTPNAQLLLAQGQVWIDPLTRLPIVPNIPLSVESLNASAAPSLSITDHSITEIELNSGAMASLGSKYTGRRDTFTLDEAVSVPVGAAVLLGTLSMIGAAGPNIEIGSDRSTPLFTGYVSGSNGVTFISIFARNNSFQTIVIPASTILNVFAY